VLGLDWRRRHEDDEGSGTEWLPASDGPVLGRLLAVLGASVGDGSAGPALPTWLVHPACPRSVRLDVVRVLVRQRGTARPDRLNRSIQVRLPAGREEAIRRLFRTVLDREAAFHGSAGATVRTLDASAAEVLGSPPTLGSPLPGRSQNR
jgi:hypothetical protein